MNLISRIATVLTMALAAGPLIAQTGGALVFVKNGDAWIMSTNGANQTKLTTSGDVNIVRLSNGVLAYSSAAQVYRARLGGFALAETPVPVPNTSGILEFDLNPEGTRMTLTYADNRTLYTMNLDGSNRVAINSGTGKHQSLMSWGRNGYIYFVQSAVGNALSQQLFRIGENSVNTPALLQSYFSQFPAAGGPNNKVAFLYDHPVKKIRVMNEDAGAVLDVPGITTGDGGFISYDYDQEVIYYPNSPSGEIWRVNTDGTQKTLLAIGAASIVDYGKLDSTPPVITSNVQGPLGNNGWYIGDVSLSWVVSDPESPITDSSGCSPVVLTADHAGQTFTCTATSAGGTNQRTVTVRIDKTPPLISLASRTPANGAGWNNTNVVVSWDCLDLMSGAVQTPVSQTVISEGLNQSRIGMCSDVAGNTATHTVAGINLDRTPPTIQFGTPSPLPNAAGWNNTNVSVPFIAFDALSSLNPLASTPSPLLIAGEGTARTAAAALVDVAGNSAIYTSPAFKIDQTKPNVSGVQASPLPVPLGTPILLTAQLSDPGSVSSGLASASYSSSIGSLTGTLNLGTGSATITLPVGVHTLCVTALDKAENTSEQTADSCVIVPVYNPDGAFVTGGGWINSPPGALAANPSVSGRANFGFVSKYQNGASVPSGDTQFQFRAGDLSFKSTAYDWLVVAGARAQFKGTGTIGGVGSYQFMLTAIDGERPGGQGMDRFRIKIWSSGGIVYDNELATADDGNPTTALGGGNVVIHQ